MNKQIVFLSGLQRTGSNLLNAIVSRDTRVFCEGHSALPNLMHGVNFTCDNFASDLLLRNKKQYLRRDLMLSTVWTYYKDVKQPIALNMNKAWTLPYHLALLPYLSDDPRVLIMLRPVTEIAKSLVHINKKNNFALPEKDVLGDYHLACISGVADALRSDSRMFLFGTYEQLLTNTENFLSKAYEHWKIPYVKYDFDNLAHPAPEDDDRFGQSGLHFVRSKIERQSYDVVLSESLQSLALDLDTALWHDYEQARRLDPTRFIV